MKVVYMGATWPQPTVTAAGVRTVGLVRCFQRLGHEVKFLSFKKPNSSQMSSISDLAVETCYCPPNDESAFLQTVREADVCVFERYTTEEMFGHFFHRHFPVCIRMLDTQDFHCLRTQREVLAKHNAPLRGKPHIDIKAMSVRLQGDDRACRELASVFRSDLAVFCSDFEVDMLRKRFAADNTALLPMFYPQSEIDRWQSAVAGVEKKDFVWIGHFNHPPNKDSLGLISIAQAGTFPILRTAISLLFLPSSLGRRESAAMFVWPMIKAQLPKSELHIYGSFCPPNFSLALPGVIVKGQVSSISILSTYKVMLAPLRYGAGIKGKVTDAWLNGVGVVTTSIGAEGLQRDGEFPGWVEDDYERFAAAAVEAYTKDDAGKRTQAYEVLRRHFSLEASQETLRTHLEALRSELDATRERRTMQQMLWTQSLRASARARTPGCGYARCV